MNAFIAGLFQRMLIGDTLSSFLFRFVSSTIDGISYNDRRRTIYSVCGTEEKYLMFMCIYLFLSLMLIERIVVDDLSYLKYKRACTRSQKQKSALLYEHRNVQKAPEATRPNLHVLPTHCTVQLDTVAVRPRHATPYRRHV